MPQLSFQIVDRIAAAVLYEGYLLYPYRPSIKNRQRWTFGGLYPQAYCRARDDGAAWRMQTQCLVRGGKNTALDIKMRFLHLVERTIRQFAGALPTAEAESHALDMLESDKNRGQSWQEGREREVVLTELDLDGLVTQPHRHRFSLPSWREREPLRDDTGAEVGIVLRQQRSIEGSLGLHVERLGKELFKLTVRIFNTTPLDEHLVADREEAQLRSLASTHTILGVRGGEFISLTDPPEAWSDAAAGCRNVGTWPVLVGEEGQKDTMLSSPIILADYPQVAPESPGDLFDSTEIDEILTLRILALTDEEKRMAAAVDERARRLLERTEALSPEQRLGLHGTVRTLQPIAGGPSR